MSTSSLGRGRGKKINNNLSTEINSNQNDESKTTQLSVITTEVGANNDKDSIHAWDPMEFDFARDIGLMDDGDPGVAVTGKTLFKEDKLSDVPCKYHDGLSGECWKGLNCPYGHERFTGGNFAKDHPELAFAANHRRRVVPISRLPEKTPLNREAHITCRITHVVSPSEFFIRPINKYACSCTEVDKLFTKVRDKEAKQKKSNDKTGGMDAYYFGLSQSEYTEELKKRETKRLSGPNFIALEEKLDRFLRQGLTFRKYQCDPYLPQVEVVAARVRDKWMRAIVLSCVEDDKTDYDVPNVRIQLLETGEKLTLDVKNVCRLPEKFCHLNAAVFRSCLFGVSPTWLVWCQSATAAFKKLVEDTDVEIIIKRGVNRSRFPIFESRPYLVKVLITKDGKTIDAAHELMDSGYALQWNPFPYRPHAKEVMDPLAFDFIATPISPRLPLHALEIENERLTWNKI